jgi:long-chain acyl-CoA synthetase
LKTEEINQKVWHRFYGPKTHATIPPYPAKNIPEFLKQCAQKWSEKKAYACILPNGLRGELTFEEVDKLSDAFAFYLRETLKLNKGDRVAIQLPNCLAYPIVSFGVFKAGCILVNTNPLYTEYETQKQYEDSKVKAVVLIDLFTPKLLNAIKQAGVEKIITVSVADFYPRHWSYLIKGMLTLVKRQVPLFLPKETISLTAAIKEGGRLQQNAKHGVEAYYQDISLDDVSLLQYTGGTTGLSKGAMLTHKNLLANLLQIAEMGASELVPGQGCIISALPLYHIFAFTVNLMLFYYNGGLNVLIPNPRPLTALKPAFAKYPINWISGVNTLFNNLPHEKWFTPKAFKHLRVALAGGTALHESTAILWEQTTKTRVVEGFGLSETSPVVTFNPIDNMVKINTVGVPVPSTEVALLDDEGQEVPLGEAGEIAIKGPQVMLGYWRNEEETKKSFKNGWFLTGDIGVFDKDGYLKIVDRKKDMILVSGFNVYPNEVEECISKLENVLEVAVIGIEDSKTGEAVKACIVKRDASLTEDLVRSHCRKFLTSYKLPKVIQFYTELPKSAVGKILRKELKKLK